MFIDQPEDSEESAKVYKASAEPFGFVMNLAKAWAWRPDVFDGFADLRSALTDRSALSKRDLAVLVSATASELRDSYCSLAWGNVLSTVSDADVAAAVLSGSAAPNLTERDTTLARWARKVVADPNAVVREDVEALRSIGLGEREIFEATVFIAFRIAFSTVNDALGVRPDEQFATLVPEPVRAAVSYGRPAADACREPG